MVKHKPGALNLGVVGVLSLVMLGCSAPQRQTVVGNLPISQVSVANDAKGVEMLMRTKPDQSAPGWFAGTIRRIGRQQVAGVKLELQGNEVEILIRYGDVPRAKRVDVTGVFAELNLKSVDFVDVEQESVGIILNGFLDAKKLALLPKELVNHRPISTFDGITTFTIGNAVSQGVFVMSWGPRKPDQIRRDNIEREIVIIPD